MPITSLPEYNSLSTPAPQWDIYNQNRDRWHTQVNPDGVHFSKMGTLATSLDFIHLIYDVDLAEIRRKQQKICNKLIYSEVETFAKADSEKPAYSLLIETFEHRCQVMETLTEDMYNTYVTGSYSYMYHSYPRHYRGRKRRQLVVLGAMLIGLGIGAIGTYLFDHATVAQISVSAGTNPATIKVLNKHETRLNLDENNIQDLKTVIEEMVKMETFEGQEMVQMQLLHKADDILNGFQEEVMRISLGLDKLREGRMSPYLVKPKELQQTLRNFRHLLKTQELHTILADVTEVYQVESSHLVFVNGTLRSIAHIPIFKPKTNMEIYRYHLAPMTLDHHTLTFNPSHQVLAINPSKTLFRPFTLDEFQECNSFHNITYCVRNNYYYKEHHPSCLKSLFVANEGEILSHCPLLIQQPKDTLIKLNHRDLLIYQSKSSLATYNCEMGFPKTDSYRFQGLHQFHLYPSCTLNTRHFIIRGSKNIYASPVKLHVTYPDFSSFKSFKSMQQHINISTTILDHIKTQKSLRVKDINALFEKESKVFTYSITIAGIIGGLILLCGLIYCYCKCCVPCFKSCKENIQNFIPASRPERRTPSPPSPRVNRFELTRQSRRNPARQSNILYPQQ